MTSVWMQVNQFLSKGMMMDTSELLFNTSCNDCNLYIRLQSYNKSRTLWSFCREVPLSWSFLSWNPLSWSPLSWSPLLWSSQWIRIQFRIILKHCGLQHLIVVECGMTVAQERQPLFIDFMELKKTSKRIPEEEEGLTCRCMFPNWFDSKLVWWKMSLAWAVWYSFQWPWASVTMVNYVEKVTVKKVLKAWQIWIFGAFFAPLVALCDGSVWLPGQMCATDCDQYSLSEVGVS